MSPLACCKDCPTEFDCVEEGCLRRLHHNVPPGKKRNLPTERGRQLGVEIARLCDNAEATRTTLHPRCKTCAFREGSVPNMSEATLMDAVKCTMEPSTKFMCHERKGHACSGWLMLKSNGETKVPWPFSDELPFPDIGDRT